MKNSDIPKAVLDAIREEAEENWPGDASMVAHTIETETEAYASIQALDFGAAAAVKDRILESCEDYSSLWEERLTFSQDEITSFAALHELAADDVPAAVLEKLRTEAAKKNEHSYEEQLSYINHGLERYRYGVELTAKVLPVRELLLRMEQILGSECYNANI